MVQRSQDRTSRHIPNTAPLGVPGAWGTWLCLVSSFPVGIPCPSFQKVEPNTTGSSLSFQHGLWDLFQPPDFHPFSLSPCKHGYFALTDHRSGAYHLLISPASSQAFFNAPIPNLNLSHRKMELLQWHFMMSRGKRHGDYPKKPGVSPQQTAPIPMTPHRHLNYFTHREMLASKWLNGIFLLLLLLQSSHEYWIFGNLQRGYGLCIYFKLHAFLNIWT